MYDKEKFLNVYPSRIERKKVIENIKRDIAESEQYKTKDSKQKVKRLNEFLKFVEELNKSDREN